METCPNTHAATDLKASLVAEKVCTSVKGLAHLRTLNAHRRHNTMLLSC
jgi:hypothetical protein